MKRMIPSPTARLAFALFAVFVLTEGALLLIPGEVPGLLKPVAILLNWPGLIILGIDETTEHYGYWGERLLHGLISLPLLAIYALLFASFRKPQLPGHCAQCGYDLRGGSQRCPECGAPLRTPTAKS